MTAPYDMPTTFSRESGFTLLELLAVLFAIALLAVLLVPAVQSTRGAALRKSCASKLRQIAQATSNDESTFGVYPSSDFHYVVLPYLE